MPVLLVAAGAVVGLTSAQGGYFPTSWGLSATLMLWATGLWLVVSGRTDAGRLDLLFLALLGGLTCWVGLSIAWSTVPAQSVLELQRTIVLLAGVTVLTQLIVATAIASRDYQDVHHDPDLARGRGSDDIFMNILSTNGFVGRFITDWAGPDAVLNKVAIRLGAPNYPGDTMTMTGKVTVKHDETGTVEVAVRGANSRGDHVTGTVWLTLPT